MKLLLFAGFLTLLTATYGVEVGTFGARPGSFVQHGVAGTVSFSSATTLRITNFHFDGGGRIVYFYYYRPREAQSGRGGVIIRSTESSGRLENSYGGTDLDLTMPSGTDVCEIQTLTVWCEPFNAIFAQVSVQRDQVLVNNGEGEGVCAIFGGDVDLPELPPTNFDNCVTFSNSIQLQWTVDTRNSEVDFEICSCRSDNPSQNQYMGFGLSGKNDSTFMIGADATIAWLDNQNGRPNAVDYFITQRAQCRGGQGVCPDTMLSDRSCVNNIDTSKLTGGTRQNRQQCVTFSRNFATGDSQCDIDFTVNQNQYIVWAIGGLGETAFIHFDRSDSTSPPLLLNRTGDKSSCDSSPITCRSCSAFSANRMVLSTDATLRLTIGPSAQERGYMAITGQSGWGIAWYVNGTLIPELRLTRGMTYTFIIEGGNNPSDVASYHPFYISDSKIGGRLRNTAEQQRTEKVFAGIGAFETPTGVGRLCQSEETTTATSIRENCQSQEEYFKALTEPRCSSGEAGKIVWTPDDSTPDTVYYQCATHQNLGWRISLGAPPTVQAASLFILALISILALFIA